MERCPCRLLGTCSIITWILALLTNLEHSIQLVPRLRCISALCYTDRCVVALSFKSRCAFALNCSLACAALIAGGLGCICALGQAAGWRLCCSRLSSLLLPLVGVPYPLDEVLLVPFTKSMLSGRHNTHSALLLQGI